MGKEQRDNWKFIAQAGIFTAAFFMPSVAAYFTIVTGNILITALFPTKLPKEEKESQSYSWKHKANLTANEDTPMPIVYGKARVRPVIKNRFISFEGSKQYLNVLYGFTGHRIDELSFPDWDTTLPHYWRGGSFVRKSSVPGRTYKCTLPREQLSSNDPESGFDWQVWHGTADISNILVDGIPIDDAITGNTEDNHYETRPGLAQQTLIKGFETTYASLPQDVTLREDWQVIQTSSTIAQNIEVILYWPNGCFSAQPNGTTRRLYQSYIIQYRETGVGDWLPFQYGEFHGDIDGARTVYTGDYIFWVKQDDPVPFYRSLRARTDGVELDMGKQYEIRIRELTALGVGRTDVVNVSTITYAQPDGDGVARGFTYPGEALLGLKLLADDRLAGDIEVTGVVQRSIVKVYNERSSSWVDADADNHAWAVYDLLANGHPSHPEYPDMTAAASVIQPVYGCGVPYTRLDYESFRTWAEFANRPSLADPNNSGAPYGIGFRLNIVFDTFTTAWDAILRICQEGRGIIFPIGARFFAMTDRAVTDIVTGSDSDQDVTQLFSMGNIDRETFRQQWANRGKKATAIETVFFDEDNGYERTEVVVRTSDWAESTTLNNPLQLILYGTTTYDQAFALATYLLNCNELLNQIVVFESNIESLQSQVGDVIRVQHDSMTGEGGKVVSFDSTLNIITLDKTVTIVAGTTYEFLVQLSDGSLRMKAVTGASNTNTLDFGVGDTWPTNPAQYDNWAFGEAGESSKLFRIIDIGITGDYSRALTCLEYSARVYQADLNSTDTLAESVAKEAAGDYSPGAELSVTNLGKIAASLGIIPFDSFNTASNIKLVEVLSKNRTTGEYESSIAASWDMEQGENWGEWEVSFRDVDVDDEWVGEWNIASNYDLYDKVVYNGEAYVSLASNNVGNTPYAMEGA